MLKSRLCVAVLVFSLVVPTLQARVQPTHGINFFSTEEEMKAGQQAPAEVGKQLPLLPDSDPTARYVQRLGAELAAHAPGEKWPYNFHVVNQKDINAFALPGGAVFVNLGTIQAADNEAQLAGVMAHEISHVVQRHGTRAATKQLIAQYPLAALGGLMGRGLLAQLAQLGVSLGAGSILLRNSRQAESEADLLGTDIMYDTGFDPHQMAVFFAKLEEQGGKQGAVAQFLSDHPNPGNRVVAVSGEVRTLPSKNNYRSDSAEFRDIKQKVARLQPMTSEQIAAWQKERATTAMTGATTVAPASVSQSFSHSEYQIAYPENWRVFGDQNSAVTIAPPNGISQNAVAYGVMINDYQPENPEASLDDATHALLASLQQSNPGLREIGNDENIRVNGVAGKSVDLIGPSPIQDSSGHAVQERDWLVAVKRRDGNLLYLVFIAPNNDFASLRPSFEQMLKSLNLK